MCSRTLRSRLTKVYAMQKDDDESDDVRCHFALSTQMPRFSSYVDAVLR